MRLSGDEDGGMFASKPTTWEYDLAVIDLGLVTGYRDSKGLLNHLGSEGWEAVAVIPSTRPKHPGEVTVLMKRRLMKRRPLGQ